MIKNVIFGKKSRITNSIIKNLENVDVVSASNLNFIKLKNSYKKKQITFSIIFIHHLN